MEVKKYLQTPGPTNVPQKILDALSHQQITHRGTEFEEITKFCIEGLKMVFRTKNDILIFPASGSGALESFVVNMLSPGDTILIPLMGLFSERMIIIAESFGIKVIKIEVTWGESVKAEDIKRVLDGDINNEIKAVCLPHNETSTGVTNDLGSISTVIRSLNHTVLFVVDAISSLGSLPLETDKHDIDIVITASQKGLMLPPGMGIVSVSKRAWEFSKESKLPKWYWDYNKVKDSLYNYQMPYTPPISLFFGLKASMELFQEEGIENVWERHKLLGDLVRNSIKALGLELFAEKGYESNSVTAVKIPENISYELLQKTLENKYGVVISGGSGKLKGKIFRIGHMGSIGMLDIYAIMGALEMNLYELGYKLELGTTARVIEDIVLEYKISN